MRGAKGSTGSRKKCPTTNPQHLRGTLADVLPGADVFIGVSAPGMLTGEMVKTMNRDPIIFACANPTPEIFPDEAKAAGAAVVSTGRSDYPNQINNVLAFPGIFRGAFDVRASDINEEMKVAAARALAGLIADDELSAEYIIPRRLISASARRWPRPWPKPQEEPASRVSEYDTPFFRTTAQLCFAHETKALRRLPEGF